MPEDREQKLGRLADDTEQTTDDVEAHMKAGRNAAEAAPSDDDGDDDVEAHMKAGKN